MGSPVMGSPPMPPPPKRPRNPAAPQKRGGNIVLWSLAGVLALALIATTTWWFAAGRYSTVPDVTAKRQPDAEALLLDADVKPQFTREHSNDVRSGVVIRTDPGKGAEILRGDTVNVVVSDGPPTVPDVQSGVTVDEAKEAIRKQGLQPGLDDGKNAYSNDVPAGKVIRLDPAAGTPLKIGERVDIVVSKGAEPKPIPDLRGKTHDEAFAALQDAGYVPVDGPQQFDPDIDAGKVIGTDPGANNTLDPGTEVKVITSNAVLVPDVTNRTPQEAQQILQGLGLPVQLQQFGGAGRVFGQNPGANTRVQAGTTIILFTIP
jgi:serine/threonine-protein kinase